MMKTRAWMDASRQVGRLLILVAMMAAAALAQPVRTMVQDTLYRADGTAATGTVTVRWQGFTTAGGQAVAAGMLMATTTANGGITIPLVANVGSTPAGGYYQVVIKLEDGTTSQEQWVVPVAQTATLAVVRAKVVPQNVAAQFVSRDYVSEQIDALATVASSGSYTDLINTPPPVNLQTPGPIGTSTPNLASFTKVCDQSGPIDVVACYGAKGDCVTDDHNAILAALNAAYSSTPVRAVKFNRPPGGCYLTSTLPHLGVSLIGVPSGQGNGSAQRVVQIRGKAGQDIFDFPDPDDVASLSPYQGYTVENIEFVVDDSVDVSSTHPYRKLGRTITDAAMSSGSAVLTSSTQGEFSRGDVGQPITVSGAGTSGAALTTTVASYQSTTQVTLTASASTTVTAASAYISILGLPVTTTVGNCAFAWDNRDGNQSNWKVAMNWANTGSIFHNVTIRGLSGSPQNSSCGVFLQPMGMPYNQVWRDSNILRLQYGYMHTPNVVNPAQGFMGADYFQWYGGNINGTTVPFVMYNGGDNRIDQVQICGTHKPQVLQAYSTVETAPLTWHVHIPEDECQTTSGAGWRVEGRQHWFEQTVLGGVAGAAFPIMWDATDSYCLGCMFYGAIQVNGNANELDSLDDGDQFTVTDNGFGNRVRSARNWSGGANRKYSKAPMREETVGAKRGDFLQRGLTAVSYNNDSDVWMWPGDMTYYGSYGSIVRDTSSDSGWYVPFTGSVGVAGYNNLTGLNGGTIGLNYGNIGQVFPATKINYYIKAKCPTSGTFLVGLYAINSSGTQNNVGGTGTVSCTSSYAVYSATADLTGYAGGTTSGTSTFSPNVNLGTATEVDVAWMAVRPWNADVLVAGPVRHYSTSGGYVGTEAQPTLTAARTWTWPDASGTVAMTSQIPTVGTTTPLMDGTASIGATGKFADAGHVHPTDTSRAGTGTCTSGQYATATTTSGVTCAQVAYGQVSGTPTIPTSLPPNGTASGDLSGTYPGPTVAQVNGAALPVSATVLGSNSSKQVVAASTTGSGSVVLATSPTLVTPVLGVATATSINGTTVPTSVTLMTTATALTSAQMPALTGDVTNTAGTLATTVGKINGLALPVSANVVGTNSSGQVAAATSHNLSLPANCVQSNASTTAYTCTTSPTFTPAAGDHIRFEALYANTASSTLAVNGASAATIKKWGGGGTLIANDLLAGHWVSATFDGTYWQLEGQLGNANATQINGTALSGLATGLLKNTTSTGVPVIATAGTDYLVPSGTAAISTSSTVSSSNAGTQAVTASAGGVTGKALGGTVAATVAAGAAAGTSPTIACTTSHVCTAVNGTVSLTVGTSPTTGALLTVTSGLTHTNYPDCVAHVALTASPYTEVSNWSWSYSTTVWTLNVGSALTASTGYTVTYECLGY